MTDVVVASDGHVSEDGRAGWAFVVEGFARRIERGGSRADVASHVVEWTAVREALAWCETNLESGDSVTLRTDSALVAKGLARRRPEMSGEAAELRAASRQALARLAARGVRATVVRVSREANAEADAAARRAAASR